MGNLPVLQLPFNQGLHGAVDIVGNQDFVARAQQCQAGQGNGGEPAGCEQALLGLLQSADSFFQGIAGWRPVQAVGVGAFVFPVEAAHRRHVGKENRRSLKNAGLGRVEPRWGRIRMMDQLDN